MDILVKICGIKTASVAKAAAKLGADFLGLNFVPSSKRYITINQAKKIIASLPKRRPKIVGVFQNQNLAEVKQTIKTLKLDLAQLHGDEPPPYCAKIKTPIIKVFGVSADFNVKDASKELAKYKVKYYMLDRKERGAGKLLNFKKVSELAKNFPIILAGGLNPKNVRNAVEKSPGVVAVDVAGGVETSGKKDVAKIKQFIIKSRAA